MRVHEIIRERTGLDNAAFRAWFGNSKVVDATGQPLRVYHGTFTEFESFLAGSHFGDQEAANARIANVMKDPDHDRWGNPQKHTEARIIPVYLSIQNPLRIQDDKGLTDGLDLLRAVVKLNILSPEDFAWIDGTASPGITKRRLFTVLDRMGYDGLVYRNAVEGRADSWVPFRPEQIKSALANRGSYDPKSPNITEGAEATGTFYHGTSTALLPLIQDVGLVGRTTEDTLAFTRWLAEQALGEPPSRDVVSALRQHARGYRTPMVFVAPTKETAVRYARRLYPFGGELGEEVASILADEAGRPYGPIFPDAKPVVLTLEVPLAWTNRVSPQADEVMVMEDIPPHMIAAVEML